MLDIFYVAVVIVFFALVWGFRSYLHRLRLQLASYERYMKNEKL
jgi:hypothetical protein